MILRALGHTRMGSCAVLPDQDLTYVPVAKNGSSSVLGTIWNTYPGIVRERVWCNAVPTSRAIVMWRDPTARAWSAYNMLCKGDRAPSQHDGDPEKPWFPDTRLDWDEWLTVLAKERYHQWTSATLISQAEYLCSPVKYEFVAWDFKVLSEKLGLELPHTNPMKKPVPVPDITTEMRANLNLIYPADYRIWEMIT